MKKNKITAYIEYAFFLLLYNTVLLIPRKYALKIGSFLGAAAYMVLSRKKIALKNLDIAFGDTISYKDKQRIAKASFQNLARNGVDFICLSRMSESELKKLFTIEGSETAVSAFQRGKGVIYLGMHYGNWEVIPVTISLLGLPEISVIARELDNPYLESYLLNMRNKKAKVIYKNKAVKAVLSNLKNNLSVGILLDQNTAVEKIFADFFGIPAATSKAAASFSIATGASIIPIICTPLENLTYHVKFGPEINHQPSGDKTKDILEITQKCNNFLENTIKNNPDFWLWGHKRWKTRPAGEKSVY